MEKRLKEYGTVEVVCPSEALCSKVPKNESIKDTLSLETIDMIHDTGDEINDLEKIELDQDLDQDVKILLSKRKNFVNLIFDAAL
jgi:hypothetical protein